MPASLDELRKAVAEKKKQERFSRATRAESQVDLDKVDSIVKRMKKKYAAEGVEFEKVGGRLGELRGIIAEEAAAKLKVQTVEDLKDFRSPLVSRLGGLYIALQKPLGPFMRLMRGMPSVKKLDFYLYSANMQFSAQQYMGISGAVAVIAGIIAFTFTLFALMILPHVTLTLKVVLAFVFGVFGLFGGALIMFLIPQQKAKARGDAVSVEIPFALRHMGTELKAGIGLYKTLQTIAVADYGMLSEEFARAITEIEEGTDTKDALRNLALRTQSRALRMALMHVIRSLKTGGNLSKIMDDIAEDVSFELRMRIRDFSEKMNFFGVLFIIGAIVVPVFIAILGSIANTPIPIPLDMPPRIIMLFFVLIMPMVLIFLTFYLKTSQPKV